jgi:hypothetical protein
VKYLVGSIGEFSRDMVHIFDLLRKYSATYHQPPRVGTVPNAAVQHGPIALPNLLCARSFTQKLCPRNGPANA